MYLKLNSKLRAQEKLKYLLRIEVARSKEGIAVCQRKYCLDLLNDNVILGAKLAKTLLDALVNLGQDSSKHFVHIASQESYYATKQLDHILLL